MEWKLAHVAQGDAEAMVIKSLLKSSGIDVKDTKESIGRISGVQVDGLGEVKLYVKEEDLEEAKELIATGEE